MVMGGLLGTSAAQAPFSLPPRGYILPPSGGGYPDARPAYQPAPPPQRYPRPSDQADDGPPPKAKPVPATKAKPAPVVAKTPGKKSATPDKTAKSTSSKTAVAGATKKSSAPVVAEGGATKPRTGGTQPASKGDSLARDLHRPAVTGNALSSDSTDRPLKAPQLKLGAPEIVIKPTPKRVTLDGPWGVPNPTKWLASLKSKKTSPPVPSILDQPHSLAEADVLAPTKPAQAALPIAEISPPEPEILKSVSPPRRELDGESPVIASTPPPQPAKVIVQPTLAAVRPAKYQRNEPEPETRSDFTPGGSTFDDPPPAAPAQPPINLSPRMGNLAIDADRVDNDNVNNTSTFHGNVNLNCDRFQMKADKVVAKMGNADSNGMEKVVGEGNVTVRMLGEDAPGFTGSGNRAIFDPATETITLQGWPKVEEGPKSLVASSADTEIRIDTKTNRLTTTGSTKTLIRK